MRMRMNRAVRSKGLGSDRLKRASLDESRRRVAPNSPRAMP